MVRTRIVILTIFTCAALALAAPTAALAAITITRVETQAAPGTAVTAFAFAELAEGTTTTTADAYRLVTSQSGAKKAWDVRVLSVTPLTHSVTGVTIPNTDLLVENANLTGVYNDLTVMRTVQAGIGSTVTTSGYFHFRFAPAVGRDSGTYTGTVQVQARTTTGSQATLNLTVTAYLTASITMLKITDATGVPSISSAAFAETAPGMTSAAIGPYFAALSATSGRWQVYAAITSAFTKATGDTLPGTAILVNGPAQGAAYVDLSTGRVLETGILRATLTSGGFSFKLAPAAGADSGDYTGTVTITASTL